MAAALVGVGFVSSKIVDAGGTPHIHKSPNCATWVSTPRKVYARVHKDLQPCSKCWTIEWTP